MLACQDCTQQVGYYGHTFSDISHMEALMKMDCKEKLEVSEIFDHFLTLFSFSPLVQDYFS